MCGLRHVVFVLHLSHVHSHLPLLVYGYHLYDIAATTNEDWMSMYTILLIYIYYFHIGYLCNFLMYIVICVCFLRTHTFGS